MEYYSRKNGEKKELLLDHLNRTSELCGQFASSFNHKNIGEILGSHHDAGKATQRFQDVLFNNQTKIDHAIVGAWIVSKFGDISGIRQLLAYIIASHHFDLCKSNIKGPRQENNDIDYLSISEFITADNNKVSAVNSKEEYMNIKNIIKKNFITKINKNDYFDLKEMNNNQKMFYMRMLYSCLIDADYSSSAEFFDKNYIETTKGEYKNPTLLFEQLLNFKKEISSKSNANIELNKLRNKVFEDCTISGKKETNLYTLTAPTGTAKTLALLSFGLQQLIHQKKERLIIVLPYLSIIEQNAQIYKDICGKNVVFIDDSNTEYTEKTKVLSDRWDSQIIITTSVKFFETLFKAKSTKLRRLHNISNSVIMFDESQSLNTDVLDCTIEIINELPKRYNSTVLFSSATPLNYVFRKNIKENWKPTEIIQDTESLYKDYAKTKNLQVYWEINIPKSYKDLCSETKKETSLYMFNTKDMAKKMYKEMCNYFSTKNCFLVSNDLCTQHKLDTINEIIQKLENKEECRISATQCIEAGVDISIEHIFRQKSPYSSIIQSAGRCVRNGIGEGIFTIFEVLDEEINENKKYPDNEYRNATIQIQLLLKNNGGYIDINNLDILDEYSELLFSTSTSNEDKYELSQAIDNEDFKETAKQYKLIENNNSSIIVPYYKNIGDYKKITEQIINNDYCITKQFMKDSRKLVVNTYKSEENILKYCSQLYINIKGEKIKTNWYLLNEGTPYYDDKEGLDFNRKI